MTGLGSAAHRATARITISLPRRALRHTRPPRQRRNRPRGQCRPPRRCDAEPMCRTDRAPQLSVELHRTSTARAQWRRWASVQEARARRHIASGRRGLGSVPHPSREVPAASQGRCISRPSAPLAAAAARAFFCARWSMASQMIVSPEWSKAVRSATLEAASLSTRGSGWVSSGPASSWEC